MHQKLDYYVLAFYCFTSIEDPHGEVAKHHDFFKNRDIRSRIYISHKGINAQMSASCDDAKAYMDWMKQDDRFKDIDFKIHYYHEHAFPRVTVKYRDQLVAMDHNADPKQGGEHVSPEQWKKMLEQKGDDVILLDVRNDYEWKIGHFEGAIKPQLDMFRQFPEYIKKLKEEYNPKNTKVMMYCTGGIRCELYSALMKDEGFQHVYQLDGGVIKYGLEQGNSLWKGKLFVFDDRLAVPIDGDESIEAISSCHYCGSPSDTYYNCANMDCNELFTCCPKCADEYQGCCRNECVDAPRLRPYEKATKPKPFRKWYHYENGRAVPASSSESHQGQ